MKVFSDWLALPMQGGPERIDRARSPWRGTLVDVSRAPCWAADGPRAQADLAARPSPGSVSPASISSSLCGAIAG